MIIVYYTKNGKVTNCHTGRGKSYVDLLALADGFNKKSTETKVHIRVVDDNSLEAHLMERLEIRRKANKEVINKIKEALDSIEDVLDDIWEVEE